LMKDAFRVALITGQLINNYLITITGAKIE
ncbi:hypothetical protein EZS27_037508, partial [termite gut metagenome]